MTAKRRLSDEEAHQRWREIRRIGHEWDPMELIDMGCPADEYDCLLIPILRRLETNTGRAEIAGFISSQMRNHFGSRAQNRDYAWIADWFIEWHRALWSETVGEIPPRDWRD